MKYLIIFFLISFKSLVYSDGLDRAKSPGYNKVDKVKFEVDHEPSKNGMIGVWAKGESTHTKGVKFDPYLHPVQGRLNNLTGELILKGKDAIFKTALQTYRFDKYPKIKLHRFLQSHDIKLYSKTNIKFEIKILGYWSLSRFSQKYSVLHIEKISISE